MTVSTHFDLSGLAMYYNTTLTQIGRQNFANASFLLNTFRFINLPPNVNGTARAANADLISINRTIPKTLTIFAEAKVAIQANELINATALVNLGCSLTSSANRSLADFAGPQTSSFESESVPTGEYASGLNTVLAEVQTLHADCTSVLQQVPTSTGTPSVLLIGSDQRTIETGGSVVLSGNLTKAGGGIAGQKVLFYVNGSYFGALASDPNGTISGTLGIPFVYSQGVEVQALVAPNSTIGIGGAQSNILSFEIVFNQTSIVIGDPPAYLPGATFSVHGNLTTTNGGPLPDAPVTVTYMGDSIVTTTDGAGVFRAQFAVPDNATDGTYFIYARFTPRGVYGPSFNFTSIDVYHLLLTVALSVPRLSWAGFSTHIDGSAVSNGTAVADATVTFVTPWGTSTTKTDSTGHFNVVFPVSPLEFAFSKNAALTVSPSEPYIAPSTIVVTLGLFNILVVILPAAIVGAAGYEAYSLGVFQNLRGRRQEEVVQLTAQTWASVESLVPDNGPEPLKLFGRALALASTRFSIPFRSSQTIREMLSLVKVKDDGEAFVAFSRVLLTAEDFLYGQKFDSSRTAEARGALSTLEVLWS